MQPLRHELPRARPGVGDGRGFSIGTNQDKNAPGLAGTIKLGAWGHFGRFDDQRFGPDGLSLADPASNGNPARHRGDGGVYGVIDQQIWRPRTGEPDKGIGVFARASASPSDRNLLNLYLDGGIVFAGLIPGRPDDVLSFGGAYARVSNRVRSLDRDAVLFGGGSVVRNFEALLEANYRCRFCRGSKWTWMFSAFSTPAATSLIRAVRAAKPSPMRRL